METSLSVAETLKMASNITIILKAFILIFIV
jgi:hypothetical protein